MANKVRNTPKPQNVLAKENQVNQKITKGILPALPSFVADYDKSLDRKGRSVKTRLAYVTDISHFLEYMIADTGLSEAKTVKEITLEDMNRLKGRDVNDYLSFAKNHENDDGTIVVNGKDALARKKSSIAGLLKFLYREDLIEYDITEKIDAISVKQTDRIVKTLEENEVMDMLDAVTTGEPLTPHQKKYWEKTKYRDKFIITLFVIAGLRISELQQLNISSFNLKREEFIIYRKRGKEAVMPMNKTLVQGFKEYMEFDRAHCTDIAPGHEDALFLSLSAKRKAKDGKTVPQGRKRLSVNQIRALVHTYTSAAVGGTGVSPHKLRATAATTAIRRGNDISKVASLLDHDNIQTTTRYININMDDKRSVLESIDRE